MIVMDAMEEGVKVPLDRDRRSVLDDESECDWRVLLRDTLRLALSVRRGLVVARRVCVKVELL